MITVEVTDADRVAGLLKATSDLSQKVVDLEINLAVLKRLLIEREAADVAAKTGQEQNDDLEKHPGTQGQRTPAKAGGGNSAVAGT